MTYPPVRIEPRIIRRPKQLYHNQHWDVARWRVAPGFLPAVCEGGGRYPYGDGERSFYVGGYDGDHVDFDPDAVRACAATVPPRTLWILDEESPAQQFSTLAVDPTLVEQRKRRVRHLFALMREANPFVRLADYDRIVNPAYWMLTRQFAAHRAFEKWQRGERLTDLDRWTITLAYRWTGKKYVLDDTIERDGEGRAAFLRWQRATDDATVGEFANGRTNASAGVEDAVDALCPSLYDFYQGDDTEGYIDGMIAESIRAAGGRPVLPFVWPRYHDGDSGNAKAGQTIPLDEFRRHARWVLDRADGLVLWGDDWDEHAEHRRAILEEAASAEVA